jgi:hypothetical protein
VNLTLHGHVPPAGEYPALLAQAGARRWPQHADFSLTHARMRAERGDVVGAVGQAARAVVETAHARACRRRLWVVNEKMLVERTGLQEVNAAFTDVPIHAEDLVGWVDGLREAISGAVA